MPCCDQPYAVLSRGATDTFIWPMFPVVPEIEPSAGEQLARWRCMRFADIAGHGTQRAAPVLETAIGIDGTWHYFWPKE